MVYYLLEYILLPGFIFLLKNPWDITHILWNK